MMALITTVQKRTKKCWTTGKKFANSEVLENTPTPSECPLSFPARREQMGVSTVKRMGCAQTVTNSPCTWTSSVVMSDDATKKMKYHRPRVPSPAELMSMPVAMEAAMIARGAHQSSPQNRLSLLLERPEEVLGEAAGVRYSDTGN